MKATVRLLTGTTIGLIILFIAPAASPQKTTPSPTDSLIDHHEAVLDAVQAERARLKSGKSSLFDVIALARDLRDVELRIATRPVERIAAFNRFRSLVRDLEADVRTALDRKMLDWEKAKVEADLTVAKREAVQIEQINKQQRSQILRERNLWRRDLDGSPMVHPTLPPKLAENRR
jgi:hypothetical protein